MIMDYPIQPAHTKILTNPFFVPTNRCISLCTIRRQIILILGHVYHRVFQIELFTTSNASKLNNMIQHFLIFFLTQHIHFDNIMRYKYRRRSAIDEEIKKMT